jgi:hypothetical protein
MPRDSEINPAESRRLAWKNYAERQLDKWVKWSFNVNGKVKYKDILKMREKYKIDGETRGWI